jgi:hypothetical protein
MEQASRRKSEGSNKGKMTLAVTSTVAFMAGVICIAWLTKYLDLKVGDAALVALLCLPILIFLVVSGKLKELSLPGGTSAKFVEEQVDKVSRQLDEVGAYEPERSTFFGKLQQILNKEKDEVSLICADVDGLRRVSQKIYGDERISTNSLSTTSPQREPKRRSERDIRKAVIEDLVFALTDAFYDMRLDKAKIDIFSLEDPDVVMIIRSATRDQAKAIAEEGIEAFRVRYPTTATAAVASTSEDKKKGITPASLNEQAIMRLAKGKAKAKGKVYAD